MNFACSSFSWETNDKKHLLGRTYDQFGDLRGNSIEKNCMFKTKYCFVGMAVNGLKTPILVDGINEEGLMGALLRYPGFAKYDTQKGAEKDINPGFLVTYLLGKCKNANG